VGVNKTSDINSTFDVSGSLAVSGSFRVTGSASIIGDTIVTGSLSVNNMVTATGLTLLQPSSTTSRIISAPGDITFYSASTSNPILEIDSIPSSLATRISTGTGAGASNTRLILAAESSFYATSTFTLPNASDIAFTEGTASLNVPLGITSNKESFFNGSLRVGRFAGGVTGAARIFVGSERTANGDAYIYLVGDTTYTSYGLGFNRGSTGANATSFIDHRGTGDFTIGSTEAANLIFKTSSTTKMLIAPGGNVGIGTTTPNATLDVSGSLTVSGSFITTGSARIVGDAIITGSLRVTGSARIVGDAIITGSLRVTGSARIVGDTIITGSTFISASLSVGPAAAGVVGEIRATNNVTAYYSDERLKTRFGNIENPIEKIMAISGFYFEPNELAQQLGYIKKKEVGVSAQEVNAVLPEVIAPAPIDEKYMTVRYEKMVPLLIEAIKDQQKQIDGLKNKLSL
jgi:cytoskeletal protein CcmA (bactofilin family)